MTQREIKFRAWNVVDGVMYDNAQNGVDAGVWIPWTTLLNSGEFVLMQYTGLKDRNGREIYEGDIIRRWHEDWEDSVSRGMAEDRWDFQLAFHGHVLVSKGTNPAVHHPDDMEWDLVDADEDYHDAVVIGNIYENPELLKR